MKRSQKLQPVVELATRATEAALIKVGAANALWQQEKAQLTDLIQYKDEYLQRFRQGDQKAMSAQKVMELRAFLVQLNQAITAQEHQVEQRFIELKQQRLAWETERSKEQAVQSLVDRYQDQERQVETKREQRENDDRNTVRWHHKSK